MSMGNEIHLHAAQSVLYRASVQIMRGVGRHPSATGKSAAWSQNNSTEALEGQNSLLLLDVMENLAPARITMGTAPNILSSALDSGLIPPRECPSPQAVNPGKGPNPISVTMNDHLNKVNSLQRSGFPYHIK